MPVELSSDLPNWAKDKIANGGKVYDFHPDKISALLKDKITSAKDYLYESAQIYIDKIIITSRETEKDPKVKLEYLKTNNEIDTFEKAVALADKWHKAMLENLAKTKKTKDLYEKSLKGSKEIMKLGNDASVYQLLTEEALDYESEYMGHCVGKGSYDKDVIDGSVQIYSIRGEDGEPHVTLEVSNGSIHQCKGKGNKTPVNKYIPYVQEFIKKQNLEIEGDVKNIGLIKDKYGVLHNLYDLPEQGIEIDDGIDLSRHDFAENPIELSRIKCNGKLDLSFSKNLPQVVDLGNCINVSLLCCDFSETEMIIFPKGNATTSDFRTLPCILDYSNCEEVNLSYKDLKHIKKLIGPRGNINLSVANNLPEFMDFSKSKEVNFSWANLNGVKEIKWPSDIISFNGTKNLPDYLDVSTCKKAEFIHCELGNINNIKWPSEELYLSRISDMPEVLDFSNTNKVIINECEYDNVKEIILPAKDKFKVENFEWMKELPDTIKVRYAEPENFKSAAKNSSNKPIEQKISLIEIIKKQGGYEY